MTTPHEEEKVLAGADHFGHRESDGIVVDLYWNYRDLTGEFRVEVENEREGTRFVLYPKTAQEAIQAFRDPFAAGPNALDDEQRAA